MDLAVRRFDPDTEQDFFEFHARVGGECFCTAWWVRTWAEWSERSAQDNLQLRQELLTRGEYDGYLLYADGQAVGWRQVGRRDRLPKLVGQFNLAAADSVWAITCFQIDLELRRQGLAARLLAGVLDDLRQRGCRLRAGLPQDRRCAPGSQPVDRTDGAIRASWLSSRPR